MKIVWDEAKRRSTLAARGLDFAELTPDFFEASLITARDGRYQAVGALRGMILSVIFKPLGSEAVTIISMRAASRKERTRHGQS